MKNELQLESISEISDDELLLRLSKLLQNSRRVESELVAHIGEVDQRQLWARYASSMFSYCTEALNLAEHEAYLRIKVARASREHPVLLEMLADGRLHLSGIVVLRPHLTKANRQTLLSRAANKTKRQIEELIAELFPKPDVPTTIRKLPERPTKTSPRRSDEQVPEPVPALSSEPEQNNSGVNASVAALRPRRLRLILRPSLPR